MMFFQAKSECCEHQEPHVATDEWTIDNMNPVPCLSAPVIKSLPHSPPSRTLSRLASASTSPLIIAASLGWALRLHQCHLSCDPSLPVARLSHCAWRGSGDKTLNIPGCQRAPSPNKPRVSLPQLRGATMENFKWKICLNESLETRRLGSLLKSSLISLVSVLPPMSHVSPSPDRGWVISFNNVLAIHLIWLSIWAKVIIAGRGACVSGFH